MEEVPKPKTPTPERLIYTPEQFQDMLWMCQNQYIELTPCVVLCGFCFMRTSELVREYAAEQVLQWSDILWEDKLIHIRPGVAKGTKRKSDERYAPLNDTARAWLEPIRQESGDCVPMAQKKFGELWREMTDKAGVSRIDNGLRHSAISYSLAANPEHGVALTSQWAGNSEKTVRKHYLHLLKPDQGKAWFAVKDISHATLAELGLTEADFSDAQPADNLAPEKPGRLVIEHFSDFLSNTPKRLRVVFDFLRLDYLLLDRQLLRPALSALLLLCALSRWF